MPKSSKGKGEPHKRGLSLLPESDPIQDLRDEIDTLTTAVESLRQELKSAYERISSVEDKVGRLSSAVEDLERDAG